MLQMSSATMFLRGEAVHRFRWKMKVYCRGEKTRSNAQRSKQAVRLCF